MLASPPLESYEFAGDYRKIGFICRVDVLNRPLRMIASLLIFERPEHLGDLGAGNLAGGVQLAVGAGDDPGGHHTG